MEYTPVDLEGYIKGLHWFGMEDHDFCRLPRSILPRLPEGLQEVLMHPSGARICFTVKTSIIGLEIEYAEATPYDKFSRTGQYGADLYVDGEFFATFVPPERRKHWLTWINVDGTRQHEYMLYMPTYVPARLLSIGVDGPFSGQHVFDIEKPIVYYGSSITQGAFASRPGLTYPAIIGRRLNADFINMGCSGTGRGEIAIAEMLAGIEASCYVMDWGANLSYDNDQGLIEKRYEPFIDTISNESPGTPIIFMSTPYIDPEPLKPFRNQLLTRINREIRRVNDVYRRRDIVPVAFVDGWDIIGPGEADLTVDRTHPNDAGFCRYVDTLLPVISGLLK